mgnify:CR=1 FL=1
MNRWQGACLFGAMVVVGVFSPHASEVFPLASRWAMTGDGGAAQAADASTGDIAIARVNGVAINKSQMDKLAAEYLSKSGKAALTLEDKKLLMQNLIRRELILQLSDVQALKKDGDIVRQVENYEDQLIITRYLEDQVGSTVGVSDEEIKEFYEKNRDKLTTPAKVEARHILLRSREDAEDALAKLKQGEDFGKLAKERSVDLPMALEGGTMGTIEKGKTLPELDDALFILAVGEISGIVQTKFGYHILTVDKIIAPELRPLDEVREEVRATILRQKRAKAFDDFTGKLKSNAKIEVLDTEFSSMAK